MAKFDAPKLLRKELAKPSWTGEPIVLSGVTDPYQPIESRLKHQPADSRGLPRSPSADQHRHQEPVDPP
jgi:hypothetical protein